MGARRAREAWAGLLGLLLACVLAPFASAQPPEAGVVDAGRPGPVARPDAGRAEPERAPEMADAGRGADDAGRLAASEGTPTGDAGRIASDAGPPDDAAAFDAAVVALDAGVADASTSGEAADDTEGLVESATSAALELTREPTTGEVVRTLLGLLGLLALAWLGGLPAVRRLEERLGITQVVTSGLPFVLLGLLMHAPGVDVLNENVLTSLTPLLQFGLGWIGFHTGFQFEARAMDQVPRGTGSVVVVLTSSPFLIITLLTAVLLWGTGLWDPDTFTTDVSAWRTLARDACLLGLAGALSAPIGNSLAKAKDGKSGPELAATLAVLDDVFGVFALALLSAWLRPSHAEGWQLPGMGWLFVTLGMAAALGLVVHFALLTAESAGERASLLLGSVAFTAGLAGYASISPLVVCFLAGLVLRNVPGGDKASFEAAFTRLERPVYLLFLTIAGALWRIDDWRGWVLLVVFLVARLGGRTLGARLARQLPASNRPPSLAVVPDRELVLAPMGHLAIAFVVAAQTLYESPAIRAIVTAVIGGSIVSEILARFAIQRSGTPPADAAPDADAPSEGETTGASEPDDGPPAEAPVATNEPPEPAAEDEPSGPATPEQER